MGEQDETICPAVSRYATRLGYLASDEEKALLTPFVAQLPGTHDANAKQRAELLVLNCITVIMPLLCSSVGLEAESGVLRAFRVGEWTQMRDFCNQLKPRLREAMSVKVAGESYAAAAAAADAADAAASEGAADIAETAASAAAAAYAAAYAASTELSDPEVPNEEKETWQNVQKNIWLAALDGLKKAIEVAVPQPSAAETVIEE